MIQHKIVLYDYYWALKRFRKEDVVSPPLILMLMGPFSSISEDGKNQESKTIVIREIIVKMKTLN